MTDSCIIDCVVDEPNHLLRVTVSGPIDSRLFTDRCLAFYAQVGRFWSYNRLYDETEATGVVGYEDLQRLAQFVAPLSMRAPTPPRVAVANPNKLIAARLPMIQQWFTKPNHQVFATLAEAEAWLLGGE